MNKVKFKAIYLPDDKKHKSKKGFDTEDGAWNYIISQICDSCKRDFKDNPIRSFCAYEWMVERYE